ncbi:asparaginase [Rossellomorea aquimaris]|jgi:L-asparaginase|uniref:asparaginase n=1 Tax=Rossellomorea aquimaris TaxID=189382 RepID=A0A5D4UHI8_9BACI|nr:asparaginase [Rossellomorea aquimaris]TYS77430.1 asparaginase [Rossellomorea aquimaris]TYS86611.1 asparaginase [Rossellomorea aquimaris]TYS87394.1 asparaginase [Rossellomorea aquimaris]
MKKDILVIHTGGTISMMEDEQTGAVTPGKENPLSVQTSIVSNLANLTVLEAFHLPSPHITPEHMQQLKEIIETKYREKSFDGVVITHGTDTLEETAYFLDLTLSLPVSLVVTGAMRSSNEIGADGLYNLISSVRVAADDKSKNKGVLVVLNDEIHSAKNVTKTHTSNVSTFQSPQYGPIGIVTKRGVLFHHQPTSNEHYQVCDISKRVTLIKAYAGMDSGLLVAIKDLQYDGVVIEALGQGNLPPDTVDGINGLLAANIPVVLVSRCFNGIVQDIYGYSGGGKQLKEKGVIFSNGLNGQKARIKLMVALSQTDDIKELETIFKN